VHAQTTRGVRSLALKPDYRVVLFVGGVGGAKLAYGLAHLLPPERLTIVVNVGDDFWHLGLKICPDSDTVMYTLGSMVDPVNGWGLDGDSTRMLEALRSLGGEAWFRLGDLDMATHLYRTQRLRDGARLTDITESLCNSLGVLHPLRPVTDSDVPTIVDTVEHGELPFQEYFVRHRWQPTLRGLRFDGASSASLTPEVVVALDEADAIVFAPSNPWLSIAPMLAIGDLRDRILKRDVPRVAMTPIIGGAAVKGPAAKLMAELGLEISGASVADYYGLLINTFIDDSRNQPFERSALHIEIYDTLMTDDAARIRVARELLTMLERT
jgi:LPPG:FO 2-phospho-L-lactate transferase